MPSILTAVFKATVGLLVNKGRDQAVEDGDVTDKNFRSLIVHEIEDIKKKVDGLSSKELLASISLFQEGIEMLYEVFDSARSRSKNKNGTGTTQAACADAFSFAKGKMPSEVIELDESATNVLSLAKERFKEARREASEAFKNEALSTSYRILAMQHRVMATILATVDNPGSALEPCKVCIEELNSLSSVQNNFNVQLKKGLGAVRAFLRKDERKKIISGVCHVNRVIYDVTLTVGKDVSFWNWPTVDTGEEKVDPLRDGRVAKFLRKQGMEHCCVTPWSFGQEGEDNWHKLEMPKSIASNSKGQFIVGDTDGIVKVFDNTGTFVKLLRLPDGVDSFIELDVILDVAVDTNDNIYVLVQITMSEDEFLVYVLNNTGDFHHKFSVTEEAGDDRWYSLTVADSGKVLVLGTVKVNWNDIDVLDVYENDGQFVRSSEIGKRENRWEGACDVTAVSDGCVMVLDNVHACVYMFSENCDEYIKKFNLQRSYFWPRIAFHSASERVVVANRVGSKGRLHVEIYTKDGEFVLNTQIHAQELSTAVISEGTTVTPEGCIAVICSYAHKKQNLTGKVIVI